MSRVYNNFYLCRLGGFGSSSSDELITMIVSGSAVSESLATGPDAGLACSSSSPLSASVISKKDFYETKS